MDDLAEITTQMDGDHRFMYNVTKGGRPEEV